MVEKQSEPSGKGRATPSRKEAEQARKKQMKTPVTRKEQLKKQKSTRDAARARTREAMANGGDDRYLPPRDQGPVRRFARDFVDSRFNVAEVLLPILVGVFIISIVFPRATFLVLVLWTVTILATVVDEVLLTRKLRKQLKTRFGPGEARGSVAYAVLRTSQIRRFRLPKAQVKRGEKLKERY